jgi:hypothetical protein
MILYIFSDALLFALHSFNELGYSGLLSTGKDYNKVKETTISQLFLDLISKSLKTTMAEKDQGRSKF